MAVRPISLSLLLQAFAFMVVINAVVASPRPPSRNPRRPLQEPSYLKFVSNATDFPLEDYYDYIIVGGGTAGCPLAATLSSRFRVLLLKSGGVAYGNQNLMSQDGFCQHSWMSMPLTLPHKPSHLKMVFQMSKERILGGSRAMNAGFYIPADQEFFERSTFN